MPRSTIALLLSMILSQPCWAATEHAPSSAEAAYRHAQAVRDEVSRQLKGKDDHASLDHAAQRLEQVLDWLQTPPTRDLATGSRSLYFRGHDVQYELAILYARMGNADKALSGLESMQRYAWLGEAGNHLLADPAFAALRDEPRFKAIQAMSSTPQRMLKDFGANSTYREQLPLEERLAGLSQFWSYASQYFAHFDNAPELDWNQAYLEFVPKVMAAENTAEYYRVLMQLAPLLRDGHTNIYPPEALNDRFFARPPHCVRR